MKVASGDLLETGDQLLSPRVIADGEPLNPAPWPDPTHDMLETPEFEAVWQCIKRWDINVPHVYAGYSGATGNHVRAIIDAVLPIAISAEREACAKILDECARDWNKIRDPGMANNARSYAKKIRDRPTPHSNGDRA